MLKDIRYAIRMLLRNPGYAWTSGLTLTLAIATSTAMFSVLNALVLQPLPFPAPDELAMLWTEDPARNLREGRSAYWNVESWVRRSSTFKAIAVFDPTSVTLTASETAEPINSVKVSPNFFTLLGTHPLYGRVFTEREAEERQRLAVISYSLAEGRFGGPGRALGAVLEIDGTPSRVIGVLPPDFAFAKLTADIWEPHTLFADWANRRGVRGADSWFVIGRLREGVTLTQAQSEMAAIARQMDAELPPADRNRGIQVVPLRDYVVAPRARLAVWMLSGVVICVLLIAAANVAGLSIARAIARTRELSIRASLGASPSRVARQLVVESMTLSAICGALGALLANATLDSMRKVLASTDTPRVDEITLDVTVLAWAIAISVMLGAVLGLAPSSVLTNRKFKGTAGLRRMLVAGQFALAMTLLASAGLLVRSWWNAQAVHPGFDAKGVLSLQVRTPLFLPAEQRAALYSRLVQEIEALPQVQSAGFISDLFVGLTSEQTVRTDEGITRLEVRRDEADTGFFRTLRVRLLNGRWFSAADGPNTPRVAVINDTMARRLWPGGKDVVGRQLQVGDGAPLTVIGVAADMRRHGQEREVIPQMFQPVTQNPSGGGSLMVRTSDEDPTRMVAAIRSAVQRVEKRVPLYGASTLDAGLSAFLAPRRIQTMLVVALAAIAVSMAAIGMFGLLSYSIASRTKEIGIRLAVGASARDIFRLVLGEGLKFSALGLACGVLGSLWAGEAARSLLFGVPAADPVSYAAACLLLTAVVVLACVLPARRALTVDPAAALRDL